MLVVTLGAASQQILHPKRLGFMKPRRAPPTFDGAPTVENRTETLLTQQRS
jgi:hypothetical protein